MTWLDEAERLASNPKLPRGDWHYDDGITDNNAGGASPVERGKQPCIETMDNGEHVLIADPYSFDDWPRMDAVGAHIAHWSPDRAAKVIAFVRAADVILKALDGTERYDFNELAYASADALFALKAARAALEEA